MEFTRRAVMGAAAGFVAGLGGCIGSSSTEPVEELQLTLSNRMDASYTFHFVVESDDSIGQWRQFTLDQDSSRVVRFEPAFKQAPLTYHAVFGDRQISGNIRPQEDGMGTCYELMFRITLLEENMVATQSTKPCAEN